ncbi:hypothetical protein TWF788_010837 [Orbilia oligospora]|uniref:Uncharacterized protein n=1 Tax=Orbilia oligospora TaxID=2813651 RepID=A0A7C8KDB6_ORBOL|nr:hypothetical protein TWF788_010837 [Orbilia oligospora]
MSIDSSQEEQGGKRRNLKRNNSNDNANIRSRKLRKVEDGDPDENQLEMDIEDTSNITAAQLRPTGASIEAPELVPGGIRPTPLTWMTYKDLDQEIVQFQPRGFHHPRQPISGYTYAPCNSNLFAKRWCERECEAWKLMWDLEDVPPGWLFREDLHGNTDIEDEIMGHQDNDSDDSIDNVLNNDYEPYVDELEEEYYEYDYGEDDGSEEIDGSGDKKDH